MCHLAIKPENKPKLPITINIHPSIAREKPAIVEGLRNATRSWNFVRPCFAINRVIENNAPHNVLSSTSGRTWVNMLDQAGPKLYIGNEPESYIVWNLKHELGHMLGFGDHIRESTDPTYYVNPKVCYGEGFDTYKGIMSYCWTNNIITDDDREMLIKEYPLYAD